MNNFTPRAAKALELARGEAERLKHVHPGTGHLILGLLLLDRGHFPLILDQVGIDRETLRASAEKSIRAEEQDVDVLSGLTMRCASLVSSAHDEAKRMGHSYTGTEHLLLAFMREEGGVLKNALEARTIDLEKLRRQVLGLLSPPTDPPSDNVNILLAMHGVQHEMKRTRDEITKKIEKIEAWIEKTNALKSDFAQLRTDVLKGNS